jgi:hypothetical protein
MTTFATPQHGGPLGGVAGSVQARRASRRDTFEAFGFLVGMTSILLGPALTVGASLPIVQ